jgi:hypothetical protein
MLGREGNLVDGVERSSGSDSSKLDKKSKYETEELPTTEVK